MGAYFSRAAIVVAFGLAAGGAFAQTQPGPQQAQPQTAPPVHTTSRGVRVLEAEPEPEPTPAPQAAPESPPPPPPVEAPPMEPAPPPPPPHAVINFCPRPFDAPDLRLVAGTDFDHALAAALKSGNRVVVDVDKPFPDHAAPPAMLGRWLGEVRAAGGTVTTKQYCEAARGALGSWLADLAAKWGGNVYRPARAYDVIMHADALDHVITQVEFSPKASRAKP